MRLSTERTLVVPGAPDDVWRLVSDPSRLSVLAPEIEDAAPTRSGNLRVVARLGRRRRTWKVQSTVDDAQRKLSLVSATPGVHFQLQATVEAAEGGSKVLVKMELEPPETWKANPQPGGIPRRAVQRLLLSVLLFALSAFGVVELPSMRLASTLESIAYAVVGLAFVVGAALLSSAHTSRPGRPRRKGLLRPRGEAAAKPHA